MRVQVGKARVWLLRQPTAEAPLPDLVVNQANPNPEDAGHSQILSQPGRPGAPHLRPRSRKERKKRDKADFAEGGS